jgi:hypothetical protein
MSAALTDVCSGLCEHSKTRRHVVEWHKADLIFAEMNVR